jgi:proteasome accessory factor C
MLTLVPWFLERPGASIAEAAEAFGVPARTIRRDLSHLDFCGLPGLGGGALFEVTIVQDRVIVHMADELRRPLRLTPREALRLVLSLQAVEQALQGELPALRSAIDKVRDAAGLSPVTAMTVDDVSTGTPVLDTIRQALREERRLRIAYQGRGDTEPRDRDVDPWQLDVTPDGWYLHAHDVHAADHRVFRLDRIATAVVLDAARVTPPPRQPLPAPRFEPGPDDVQVEVRLGPSARWIADAFDVDRVADHDGVLHVHLRTDAPPWVARVLLMGAPDVEIVHPPELAAQMNAMARAAREHYAGGSGPN